MPSILEHVVSVGKHWTQWCSGKLKRACLDSFFAGCIGSMRLSVRYLMIEEKKGLEKVCKPLLVSERKPPPTKQSVKLKC